MPKLNPRRDPDPVPNNNEEGQLSAPFLVLPYDDGLDSGVRPIPNTVTSYLSEAVQISVDGLPFTGGRLPRDRPAIVTVKVANWGDADTTALITLWWADPTVMFTGANLRFDGISDPVWVDVARRDGSDMPGISISAPFTLIPTTAMPDHVCLLAEITAGDAGAPGIVDPINNRHYAQHNIDLVHVVTGRLVRFNFFAANPFETDARVVVKLGPMHGEAIRSLERIYLAEAAELAEEVFSLQLFEDTEGDRRRRELAFDLAAGERRLCQGLVLGKGLKPGQFSAGEVKSTAVSLDGKKEEDRHGSFGVIIFPAD